MLWAERSTDDGAMNPSAPSPDTTLARPKVDIITPRGDELHADLRAAADTGPLAEETTTGAIVVLRHGDVTELARDRSLRGVGLSMFDLMGIPDGILRDWYRGLMFTTEGDHHNRLRRLVSRAFTPKSADKLRTVAAERAEVALHDIVSDGGGDLAEAFSLVPMRVMCALLGVPEEDVPVFAGWTDALSPVFGFMTPEEIAAADEAIVAMLDYIEALTVDRRKNPADDLISALIGAEDAGDRLTHDELVAMVAMLLAGGHDTTTSQIGCTLLTLLRHPDQIQRLRQRPGLLPSAVDETIRYEPSIAVVPRTTIDTVAVGGSELGAGTLVFLCTAAANREPGVWVRPDEVDVARFTREDTPALLSFGAGPHYCLGAALARVTLQEVVRTTIVNEVHLDLTDDPADISWRVSLGRSPETLRVAIAHN